MVSALRLLVTQNKDHQTTMTVTASRTVEIALISGVNVSPQLTQSCRWAKSSDQQISTNTDYHIIKRYYE